MFDILFFFSKNIFFQKFFFQTFYTTSSFSIYFLVKITKYFILCVL